LLVALGLLILCHAFVMSFSARIYDGFFYAAHLIRLTSFGIVLYGLVAEMLRLFRRAESRNVELECLADKLHREIEERRKRESEIQRLNQSLEATLDERTRFARRSEIAALNMMQDAQQARAVAETALMAVRESEEKVQAIVESAMDAVITIDDQSRITGWNRCAANMFGWKADEVMNRSLTETIIPSHLHERHLRGMQRFLTAQESLVLHRRIEMTARRRDGAEFPVELSIASFQLKGAHTFSAFVRDITQTKEYEARQKQLIDDLQSALAQVKTLKGLLPICAHCKKIRDDTGYWTQLEIYMVQHADVSFTHGICPECMTEIRESMESDDAPQNSSSDR
jgi:PAS domain S-box-containing protein